MKHWKNTDELRDAPVVPLLENLSLPLDHELAGLLELEAFTDDYGEPFELASLMLAVTSGFVVVLSREINLSMDHSRTVFQFCVVPTDEQVGRLLLWALNAGKRQAIDQERARLLGKMEDWLTA